MKQFLKKKINKKPSKEEIERVKFGIQVMQTQFQLMGY